MPDAKLLSLIGLIYDAAIDPERWHEALNATREHLGFFNAFLSLVDLARSEVIISANVNVAPEYQAMTGPKYLSSVAEMWGGAERLALLVVEEPIIQSCASDPESWAGNPYYEEFARPQGLVDAVVVPLIRDRHLVGDLAFGRHRSAGPIGEGEIEQLKILAPHIRRAALVSGILNHARSAALTFEAAVDASPAGVVLLTSDMSVVYANGSASLMLEVQDPIRQVGGRFELRRELIPGQLAGAVAAASEDFIALGRRGIGIPAQTVDGAPLIVRVMPLTPRKLGTRFLGDAVAAIFIAKNENAWNTGDALGLLFGLSPMEARVFDLVAAGLSTPAMALALGIAPSTVRSHLLKVFEKTGRHKRAELCALAREIRV